MADSRITIDAVRHVARLAAIALTPAEEQRMQAELDAILDYMAQLDDLDVSSVEPTAHALLNERDQQDGECDGGQAQGAEDARSARRHQHRVGRTVGTQDLRGQARGAVVVRRLGIAVEKLQPPRRGLA